MESASGVDLSRHLNFLRTLAEQSSQSYGDEVVIQTQLKALQLAFPGVFHLSAQLFISPKVLVSVRNLASLGECCVDLLSCKKSLAGLVASSGHLTITTLNDSAEAELTDVVDLRKSRRFNGNQKLGSKPVVVCCPMIWSKNWESLLTELAEHQHHGYGDSAEWLLDGLRDSAVSECLGSVTLAFDMHSAEQLDRCINNLVLLSAAMAPLIVYHAQTLLEDMGLAMGVTQYGKSYQYILGEGWAMAPEAGPPSAPSESDTTANESDVVLREELSDPNSPVCERKQIGPSAAACQTELNVSQTGRHWRDDDFGHGGGGLEVEDWDQFDEALADLVENDELVHWLVDDGEWQSKSQGASVGDSCTSTGTDGSRVRARLRDSASSFQTGSRGRGKKVSRLGPTPPSQVTPPSPPPGKPQLGKHRPSAEDLSASALLDCTATGGCQTDSKKRPDGMMKKLSKLVIMLTDGSKSQAKECAHAGQQSRRVYSARSR